MESHVSTCLFHAACHMHGTVDVASGVARLFPGGGAKHPKFPKFIKCK